MEIILWTLLGIFIGASVVVASALWSMVIFAGAIERIFDRLNENWLDENDEQ